MKRKKILFILMYFLIISCVGCSDSNEDKENTDLITGTWEWTESTGGVDGITLTPESTGEIRKVVFEENGNVIFYKNNEVILSSTYTLGMDKTIFSNDLLPVIYLDNALMYSYSIPYTDQLELLENIYDGYMHFYVKSN